jgi:hypothetical protein
MSRARPLWLIVTPVYLPSTGGGAIYTDTLARALAADGSHVVVATEACPGQRALQQLDVGPGSVTIKRIFRYRAGRAVLDFLSYWDYAWQNVEMFSLARLLREAAGERGIRDAVVLIHSSLLYKPSVLPLLLGGLRRALQGRVGLIVDVRDYNFPQAKLPLLERFDRICTSSPGLAADLAGRLPEISERLSPIDMPFDGPAAPSEWDTRVCLERAGLVRGQYLFNPNGISDAKHYPVMRAAMALLRARPGFEDMILMSAGRERDRRPIDRQMELAGVTKSLGLADHSTVLKLMSGAYATLVLSDREAISRSALEAMWIGGNVVLPNLAEFRRDCPEHVCAELTPEGVAAFVASLSGKPKPHYNFERHAASSFLPAYKEMMAQVM